MYTVDLNTEFIIFPAVSFLENWKRKSATLAHQWDCMDIVEEEVIKLFFFVLILLFLL